MGKKEVEKKERERGETERERSAVAVRHGVIKASHDFLWVKRMRDAENEDWGMIQDRQCGCLCL